jgi:hypothetical protein
LNIAWPSSCIPCASILCPSIAEQNAIDCATGISADSRTQADQSAGLESGAETLASKGQSEALNAENAEGAEETNPKNEGEGPKKALKAVFIG